MVATGAGCTPSGFLAGQFLRAPKSFPKIVAPLPRVYFSFPTAVMDRIPEQVATVGNPPATLAYRCVPPGDYQTGLVLTNYPAHGKLWPLYRFPARTPTQSPPSRGTVVLLHGYGLDQESMIPWALKLAEDGRTGVLLDLRGHGHSGGDRISFGLQESRDLTDLMDELVQRNQARWPVQVVGVSYGAAVALRWASQEPRVQSVVAITPYDRLEVAVEGIRRNYAGWLPEGLIQRATRKVPPLLGAPPDGLDPLRWMEDQPVSALFVAASADTVAPPESVRRLHQASRDGQILELEGPTHELAPFRLDLLAAPVAAWLDLSSTNPSAHSHRVPGTRFPDGPEPPGVLSQ